MLTASYSTSCWLEYRAPLTVASGSLVKFVLQLDGRNKKPKCQILIPLEFATGGDFSKAKGYQLPNSHWKKKSIQVGCLTPCHAFEKSTLMASMALSVKSYNYRASFIPRCVLTGPRDSSGVLCGTWPMQKLAHREGHKSRFAPSFKHFQGCFSSTKFFSYLNVCLQCAQLAVGVACRPNHIMHVVQIQPIASLTTLQISTVF